MTESQKARPGRRAADGAEIKVRVTDDPSPAGQAPGAVPPEPARGVEEGKDEGVRELEEALDQARKEAASNFDRFLRATAELENYRKRAAREMADYRKYANEALIRGLLPIVDNLELAIHSSSQDEKANSQVVKGVSLTLAELLRVLDGFGVKAVEAAGKPFDPNFHQAFLQEEADGLPENTVVKEFQKGYLLHERLIRPAMVIVSKKSAPRAGEPENSRS